MRSTDKKKLKKPLEFIRSKVEDEINLVQFEDRKVIITESINKGVNLSVYHHNDKIDYTYDFKNINTSQKVNEYLQNILYKKLDKLKEILDIDFYVFINLTTDGIITVYDMNVNDTFMDYDTVQSLCDEVGLFSKRVIFSGNYQDYKGKKKNILMRYDLELPSERRLFKKITRG